jgi:hypothetical protein
MPIVSGSSPIPWSFPVWFYLYVAFFEAVHILSSSRPHSPTPQLALFQLAGSIASAVVVKEAVLFSRLLGPRFYITSAVSIFIFYCVDRGSYCVITCRSGMVVARCAM